MEDAVPSSRVIEVESRAIVTFDPCRQSADGGLASDLLRSDLRGASDDSVFSGDISHGPSDRISALAHFAAVEIGSLDGYDLIWAHSIERCDACPMHRARHGAAGDRSQPGFYAPRRTA